MLMTKKRHKEILDEELDKLRVLHLKESKRKSTDHEADMKLCSELIERVKLYRSDIRYPESPESRFAVTVEMDTEMVHYAMDGREEMCRVIAHDIEMKVYHHLRPLCHMDKLPRVRR